MQRIYTYLICATLAITGLAHAQDTGGDTAPTGRDALKIGQAYPVSEHGDWQLRCLKAPEGKNDPCQLYQLMKDQNGNSVAEINVFNVVKSDKIAAGATIITPLETLLTRQLALSIDGALPKVYPFTFCTQVGCFSRLGLTGQDMAALRAGNEAKITIVPAQSPTKTVILSLSLKGFTAGFEALGASN